MAVAIGGLLPVLLILVAGSWLVQRGATAGMIFGALTYVLLGMQPALQTFVDGISGPGLWLVVTLRRISEASRAVVRPDDSARVWLRPPHHGLLLSGVTFAYGSFAEPVIRNLDLAIPHGEHLAVVGPSGVGKSTLANVIAGVLQPQAGEVLLGGVALRDLDPAMLAQHRVLIPQEAYVFAGSLRENLAYLHEDAHPADIDRAVQLLGMRALVDRLGGYDAELDPATLSAGERQLVTLVRAYVSPAWLASSTRPAATSTRPPRPSSRRRSRAGRGPSSSSRIGSARRFARSGSWCWTERKCCTALTASSYSDPRSIAIWWVTGSSTACTWPDRRARDGYDEPVFCAASSRPAKAASWMRLRACTRLRSRSMRCLIVWWLRHISPPISESV